jgi:nucleolar protein 56
MIIAIIGLIGTKDQLIEMSDADVDTTHAKLTMIIGDDEKAKDLVEAAKNSMGTDFADLDLINITNFTRKIKSLIALRTKLYDFMTDRMRSIAPNMTSIIGEFVGAKLIAHAGSLTNLAKYPASTIQILGAEKALFRALKTRGKTPK